MNNTSKKQLQTICPQKTTKISNIRKSQYLSLFNDRKSIYLLPVNLDVLLRNRYAES